MSESDGPLKAGRKRWWWLIALVALAALAYWATLPPQYLKRSRITDALLVAGACKTIVAEFVHQNRRFPSSAKEAGCLEEPTGYTAGTRVSGGRILVTIRDVHPSVNGKDLVVEATRDAQATVRAAPGDGIRGWHCATNAPDETYEHFPANCRRPPLPP